MVFIGTREGKTTASEGEDFFRQIVNFLNKTCKCCQNREDSDRKQAKRGSLIEGRANIEVDLGNSRSKVNNQKVVINNTMHSYNAKLHKSTHPVTLNNVSQKARNMETKSIRTLLPVF